MDTNYYCHSTEEAMTIADARVDPTRLQGKYGAMVVCWILGLGSLVSWSSMLTIGDYFYNLFPKDYHPERVLTLVYQPFALVTMAILAHNESMINTRRRNLTGYILFFLSTLALLGLDLATSGKGGIGSYISICVIVAAFGVADAHVQGGMVGDLSFMCPEFIQSFLAGLAASGALTSALRLITKAAFKKRDNGLRKGVNMYELVMIAMYSVLDLISRYIPLVDSLKIESRKGLMYATLSRFLLIPAFYFTAHYGGQGWMITLVSFLGLTNGYLTVCVLTEAPKGYKLDEPWTSIGSVFIINRPLCKTRPS